MSGSGETKFNKSDLEDAITILKGVQTTVGGPAITKAVAQNSIAPYLGEMSTDAGMKWMSDHVSSIATGVSTQLQTLSVQAGCLATLLQQSYDQLTGQDSATGTDYQTDANNINNTQG